MKPLAPPILLHWEIPCVKNNRIGIGFCELPFCSASLAATVFGGTNRSGRPRIEGWDVGVGGELRFVPPPIPLLCVVCSERH